MTRILLAVAAGAGKDSAGHKQKGGVLLYRIDPAKGTAESVESSEAALYPSYLAWSGTKSALYVAGELPEVDGQVTALHRTGNRFASLGHVATGGNGAVHLCLDRTGNFLFAANYQDSHPLDQVSVAVFPLLADGSLGAMTGSARHAGHGEDTDRQSRPHCHGVAISPDNRLLAAVDLGTDSVYFYRFDAATGAIALASQLRLPPGSGPRHPVFHPSKALVYVTGELDPTLMTIAFDSNGAEAKLIASEPATLKTGNFRNYPSGIEISPDGHYVLAANRNADTIAVFFVDAHSGIARLRDEVDCGGKFPRAIRLDPSARLLAVANQKSDGVSIFNWDFSTGKLSAKPILEIDVPIPFDAVFIDG
jgi:6-phosphogluconolactonase